MQTLNCRDVCSFCISMTTVAFTPSGCTVLLFLSLPWPSSGGQWERWDCLSGGRLFSLTCWSAVCWLCYRYQTWRHLVVEGSQLHSQSPRDHNTVKGTHFFSFFSTFDLWNEHLLIITTLARDLLVCGWDANHLPLKTEKIRRAVSFFEAIQSIDRSKGGNFLVCLLPTTLTLALLSSVCFILVLCNSKCHCHCP